MMTYELTIVECALFFIVGVIGGVLLDRLSK